MTVCPLDGLWSSTFKFTHNFVSAACNCVWASQDSNYADVAGLDDFLDVIDEEWVRENLATDGEALGTMENETAVILLGHFHTCGLIAVHGRDISGI